MAAVALLVVVAIAGIVLGTMRGKGTTMAPTAGDSTPAAAPAMTEAPPAAADAAAKPNQVVFAPGSDQLSDAASAKLAKIAETAKKSATGVTIASRIESRPDRANQMELAKKRSAVVRQALEAAGIPLARIRIDIAELPNGGVPPAEANWVDVVLR
jgi:outer membrane protein OmpA-like peptidoglycan-associated protein